MKVYGKKINSTDKVLKLGLMEQDMTVLTSKAKSMVMDNLLGLMALLTVENSLRTISKDKANIIGQMAGNTQGNG